MSNFITFKNAIHGQMESMTRNGEGLFVTDVTGDQLWEAYLAAFPPKENPIFRERTVHDCSCCRHFVKRAGAMAKLTPQGMVSIWDVAGLEYPYSQVAQKMSELVKSSQVTDIFLNPEANLGLDFNHELIEGKSHRWDHFHFRLPIRYVKSGEDINSAKAVARDNAGVFGRSMKELTIEAGLTILELIDQGSLYRGEEHKANVQAFINEKRTFDSLPEDQRDHWLWVTAQISRVSRVRNTALGTLLINLSQGMELDEAVTAFEKVMAPTNYKRPKSIITARMVEEAEAKILELGFENSLGRRHATPEDVSVNDVIFVDRSVRPKMKDSLLGSLKEEIPVNPKTLKKVEEVDIETFLSQILPQANSLELMVEGRHRGNLMSLISPLDKSAPSMLKWGNNFSWSYNGELADSMKQNVKAAGGKVDGVLRYSIQWNDTHGDNLSDLDAHCLEPDGNHIYFGNLRNHHTSGVLDVDIRSPRGVAVENITWSDARKMLPGEYRFMVHNYSKGSGSKGFSAEIEFDGQVYSFEYPKALTQDQRVEVARVRLNRDGSFEMVSSMDSTVTSHNVWGLRTNQWARVSMVMASPNHWEDSAKTGNKHHFFILEDCRNDSQPRGFFNEFLSEELTAHRKVFEALGSKMRVESSDHQLSGLGFSSTQKNSVLARVGGAFSRTIKITL